MGELPRERETDSEEKEPIHLKEALASGYINFLFGAGVNGSSFPNMRNGFESTKKELAKYGCRGLDIESDLRTLSEEDANKVIGIFIDEFNKIEPNRMCSSYDNLKNLMTTIYSIIDRTENRQAYSKKINIFTLNYDRIVEGILDDAGYFYHIITANKDDTRAIPDVIGYDVVKKGFVPTFSVSKIHGSAESNNRLSKERVILPVKDKGGKALSREFFRVLFKMKGELEKRNAILFIIGYSGADEDVNSIIKETNGTGLRIYWLKYNNEDTGISDLNLNNIITIDAGGQDSTKKLCDLFAEVNRS